MSYSIDSFFSPRQSLRIVRRVALLVAVALVGAISLSSTSAHAQAITKGRKASDGKAVAVDLSDAGILRTNAAVTVFATAARTVTANSTDQVNYAAKGIYLVLDITAASGTTPTLDVKLQGLDPVSAKYVDIPGAVYAQKTTTGTSSLVLYPGVTESANAQESHPLPLDWRAVATIGGGTPSFTFTLAGSYLQ